MKALSVVMLTLLVNISFAQTWSAAGPGPANWNDALNWTPNVVPTMGNTAIFNGTSNVNCVLNIAPTIGAIQISGYSGDISLGINNLTITAGAANSFFNSGSISGNGSILVTSNFAVSFAGTTTGVNVNVTATLATAAGFIWESARLLKSSQFITYSRSLRIQGIIPDIKRLLQL